MSDGTILTIKRPITVRAVVTPLGRKKPNERSATALLLGLQLAQLEQEGQQVVDEVRRQSANS